MGRDQRHRLEFASEPQQDEGRSDQAAGKATQALLAAQPHIDGGPFVFTTTGHRPLSVSKPKVAPRQGLRREGLDAARFAQNGKNTDEPGRGRADTPNAALATSWRGERRLRSTQISGRNATCLRSTRHARSSASCTRRRMS